MAGKPGMHKGRQANRKVYSDKQRDLQLVAFQYGVDPTFLSIQRLEEKRVNRTTFHVLYKNERVSQNPMTIEEVDIFTYGLRFGQFLAVEAGAAPVEAFNADIKEFNARIAAAENASQASNEGSNGGATTVTNGSGEREAAGAEAANARGGSKTASKSPTKSARKAGGAKKAKDKKNDAPPAPAPNPAPQPEGGATAARRGSRGAVAPVAATPSGASRLATMMGMGRSEPEPPAPPAFGPVVGKKWGTQ